LNIQKPNLEDLISFYFRGKRVVEALGHIQGLILSGKKNEVTTLLRNHRFHPVKSKSERYLRAGMDDFLLGCDVLEIAILTGFIGPPDQTKFWNPFRTILGNKEVRPYFEEYYPVKLPQLLALRLESKLNFVEEDKDNRLSSFMLRFLALDRGFMENLNGRYLLRLLDSFKIQGYRFSAVSNLISQPDLFVERILIPPESREVPDIALQELLQFFQFAESLEGLLLNAEGSPLVCAEAWSHYSYWFDKIGDKLNKQLGSALDKFLNWEPIGKKPEAKADIQRYVRNAKVTILHLTKFPDSHLLDVVFAAASKQSPLTKITVTGKG
jgi:hypothetical protein